ncbi:MAG: hypothetical protein RL595_3016 [Planctomycetota bacterium]|jgi:hypothetical protein
MGKLVAILQSNYIPWKGYFDLIRSVDEFILYDEVQYTKRDWRNRNKIKTSDGIQWLTIPVEVKGKYFQRINETLISDPAWAKNHWTRLKCAYGKAAFFKQYQQMLESLYLGHDFKLISEVNELFIRKLCEVFGISTSITQSTHYPTQTEDPSERLLQICLQAKATCYVSGPAAKDYLNVDIFKTNGITVEWMDYCGYQEYPQLNPPFDHYVSVLDLLLNVGPDAQAFMEKVRDAA